MAGCGSDATIRNASALTAFPDGQEDQLRMGPQDHQRQEPVTSTGPGTILLLLACILGATLACGGCGNKQKEEPPRVSIWDNADILSPSQEQELDELRGALEAKGVRLAILTVNEIPGREPGQYADRAFHSFPTYDSVFKPSHKPDKATRRRNNQIAEEWRPTGILIVVSLKPRLIQVRRGDNLVRSLTREEIWQVLETEGYPAILQKNIRGALLHSAIGVIHQIQTDARENEKPALSARLRNTATAELEAFLFPHASLYYVLALDPLLNLLALLLHYIGSHTWVVGIWVVALYVLCRTDVLGKVMVWINLGLLRLALPRLVRLIPSAEAARQLALSVVHISLLEARLIRWGMGLPIITILTLITLPLWENVMTLRMHLYSPVASLIDARDLLDLSGGFLFWQDFHSPVGMPLAVVLAVFYGGERLLAAAIQGWISEMDASEVVARNIPLTVWGEAKLWRQVAESGVSNPLAWVGMAVAFPAVASPMPALSILYYVLIGAEGTLGSARSLKFLLRQGRSAGGSQPL